MSKTYPSGIYWKKPDRVPERTWAHVISFLIVVCILIVVCTFWQLSIDLNLACQYNFKRLSANWQPCPALFRFYAELLSVTNYISSYVGAKRLVFHPRPRDGHVIIASRCLILTAVNLIVLIRMAYITKRLVKMFKIYCDIWHRLTWSVCTDGRAYATS